MDDNYLKRKRRKLEKIGEKIVRKRETMIKSMNELDVMEQTYALRKKNYEKNLFAIQKQLEFCDPERLTTGQDKLNQFRLKQQQMTQERER